MKFSKSVIIIDKPKKRDFFPENFSNEVYYSHLRSTERINYFSEYTIKYVVKGQEVFSIDGRNYTVNSNEMLIIPRGMNVKTLFCDAQSLSVFLDEELIKDIHSSLILNTIEPVYCDNTFTFPSIISSRMNPLKESLNHILKNIKVSFLNLSDNAYYNLGEHLIQNGLQIEREVKRIDKVKPSTRVEIYQRLERAYTFIMDDSSKELNLTQLSQIACISKYNFLKYCKQVYGKSPKQIQIERRINRAFCFLDSKKEMPIGEIALNLGYSDSSSFTHQFKQVTGVSPSYVKSCLKHKTNNFSQLE
jgi:AraC-like DNA-binding protein